MNVPFTTKIKTLRFSRGYSYFYFQMIWTKVPTEMRYMFKAMAIVQVDKEYSEILRLF